MASLRRMCTDTKLTLRWDESRCLVDLSFFNALGTKKKRSF